MSNWQSPPNAGFYPGQQGGGYPYPQQNPGYPPPQESFNQPYPPQPHPPGPGFIPPGAGNYGQGPPPPTGPPFGEQNPSGMYGSSYAEDPSLNEAKGFGFTEKSIRNGFIRKVYSILMVQLLITLGIILLFILHQPTRQYVERTPGLFMVAFLGTLVCIIAISCCSNVRRKAPMNFIFLFIFTACEGFLLGTVSLRYAPDEIALAVGITAVVCFALTCFAFQTKYDFTGMHTVLFIAVIVLMLFGFLAMLMPGKTITLIYASFGALIFSFYLIYDTQIMMGGKHKYSISPEEYIFAALSLYLDIVNIFIYILTIIGASRD